MSTRSRAYTYAQKEKNMGLTIIEAKSIPVEMLTERLGGRYSHTDRHGDLWYYSPFRPEEKTASFKVTKSRNKWHDFGLSNTFAHQNQGNGGDIVDLWCDYHFKDRRFAVSEALQALEQIGHPATQDEKPLYYPNIAPRPEKERQPRYEILTADNRISFGGLKDELNRRRISVSVAERYLKQGQIRDLVTDKKYTCFLFENDKGGFEASIPNPSRNSSFKTCIGPKASTRLMGAEDQHAADIFEGFFDMLSWLELKGLSAHLHHTYVANSVSLVGEVCEKIIAFKDTINTAFLFMDNDDAGHKATQSIVASLKEQGLHVSSYEQVYRGSKDVSEHWMKGDIDSQFRL